MDIVLVSGKRDSGKTAYLRSLLESEECAGCLAPKAFCEDRFIGYDLEIYPRGGKSVLVRERRAGCFEKSIHHVREESGADYIFFGPYLFYNGVFKKTRSYLSDKLNDSSFCRWILDEIGPLEMAGEGLAPLLATALEARADREGELFLSLRPGLVGPVQEKFGFTADRTVQLNS